MPGVANERGDRIAPREYAADEDLLASGYGIENAIREPQGNVTWLRWNTGPSAQ